MFHFTVRFHTVSFYSPGDLWSVGTVIMIMSRVVLVSEKLNLNRQRKVERPYCCLTNQASTGCGK